MKLIAFSKFVFCYLSLRVLVAGMEEFLIQPSAWYYVRYLGQSNLFLGFLLAGFSIGALVSAPCFGALDTKFQAPKIILLMCCIVKFIGNIFYTLPVTDYFPLVGRLMSGIGEGTVGIIYGSVAQATSNNYRAQAFLYFEGLYSVGTALGPMVGSFLTFKFDMLGFEINAGNSPGLILTIIWFILLVLTAFLPSDLIQRESQAVEVKPKPPRKKSKVAWKESTEDILKHPEYSGSTSDETKSEDESKTKSETKKFSISRICSLYFVIFQSWVVLNIGLFYTPLLASRHIGLGLAEIKLIYVNAALFSFLLFLASYVVSGFLSEKTFIALGIASHFIPLIILFYFALSWDQSHTMESSYLLWIFMTLLSVSFVIFPLASSLLSKETPVHNASLYQSVAFTVLHLPNVIGRVIAGATFNEVAMTLVSVVLLIGLLVELIWFLAEYHNMYPVSVKQTIEKKSSPRTVRRSE